MRMDSTARFKSFDINISNVLTTLVNQRSKIFGFMIIGALLAFELFNYSTTEFALNDVLGPLAFIGIPWSTILSIAFCGIDFAGVARLFTPEQGADEPAEVWYLFGAWILAAAMNATLTWWGVSVAIANHLSQGTAVVNSATIQSVVPIFVAVMVWVIRIMIIGTFSLAGERMFSQPEKKLSRPAQQTNQQQNTSRSDYQPQRPTTAATQSFASRPNLAPTAAFKPTQKVAPRMETSLTRSAEPTYHNLANSQQVEQYEARG